MLSPDPQWGQGRWAHTVTSTGVPLTLKENGDGEEGQQSSL